MSPNTNSAIYLFRVDGSKDNDLFFNSLRPSVSNVYAGLDLRLGSRGWVPDFVGIKVEDSWEHFSLTIIELESTDSIALVSCRKYLPEQSVAIIESFSEYLQRVIQKCDSSADPRKAEFEKLRMSLLAAKRLTVATAGGLRSSISFVEELPLIDQPRLDVMQLQAVQKAPAAKSRTFRGDSRLSAGEAKALSRTIMVLDAIIRKRDHSAANFKTWRAQDRSQPLKYLLKQSDGVYPSIRSFLSQSSQGGITFEIETVLTELANIWSTEMPTQINPDGVRDLIENYYSIALEIKGQEFMPSIFEAARKHLNEMER